LLTSTIIYRYTLPVVNIHVGPLDVVWDSGPSATHWEGTYTNPTRRSYRGCRAIFSGEGVDRCLRSQQVAELCIRAERNCQSGPRCGRFVSKRQIELKGWSKEVGRGLSPYNVAA